MKLALYNFQLGQLKCTEHKTTLMVLVVRHKGGGKKMGRDFSTWCWEPHQYITPGLNNSLQKVEKSIFLALLQVRMATGSASAQ